jgi:hypothetical protein
MNTEIRDNLLYLYGLIQGTTYSAVFISRGANQSIPDTTDTNISFDTEVYDYGGWWTSGTNIVVPAGAVPTGFTTIAVWVIPIFSFASNSTGRRKVIIQKNGSTQETFSISALSGDPTVVILPTLITVAAADIITIQVYQSSGGALNVTGNVKVVRHAAVV